MSLLFLHCYLTINTKRQILGSETIDFKGKEKQPRDQSTETEPLICQKHKIVQQQG